MTVGQAESILCSEKGRIPPLTLPRCYLFYGLSLNPCDCLQNHSLVCTLLLGQNTVIKTIRQGKSLFHLTGYKTVCHQGSRAGAWGLELGAETEETAGTLLIGLALHVMLSLLFYTAQENLLVLQRTRAQFPAST